MVYIIRLINWTEFFDKNFVSQISGNEVFIIHAFDLFYVQLLLSLQALDSCAVEAVLTVAGIISITSFALANLA